MSLRTLSSEPSDKLFKYLCLQKRVEVQIQSATAWVPRAPTRRSQQKLPTEDGANHVNALASLRHELGASKAHVDQAPCRFATLLGAEIFRLSHCLLGAIAQVGPVRHDHRRLGAEQELVLRDPCRPEARTNLRARVVSNVSIEIATMAILVGLLLHGDLDVDVITVLVRHPPIDLHSDAKGKARVQDFQRLVWREGCIHQSTNVVVLEAHWRMGTGKL